MKYTILILSLAFLMNSCKAKKGISIATTKDIVDAKVIINSHQALNEDFNTLVISASTSYKDKKNSHSFTTDIRIEKDKNILVSVRIFGITMAKALITPNEVKYYENIDNTFFEGDFSQLSQWLGTPLSFEKIQNLLLGKALYNLSEKKYMSGNDKGLYSLTYEDNEMKEFYAFEPENIFLKKQIIEQNDEKRKLLANYDSHQIVQNLFLPLKFNLQALQENENNTVNIKIDYKSIKINETINFPYSVPSGYSQKQLE